MQCLTVYDGCKLLEENCWRLAAIDANRALGAVLDVAVRPEMFVAVAFAENELGYDLSFVEDEISCFASFLARDLRQALAASLQK